MAVPLLLSPIAKISDTRCSVLARTRRAISQPDANDAAQKATAMPAVRPS